MPFGARSPRPTPQSYPASRIPSAIEPRCYPPLRQRTPPSSRRTPAFPQLPRSVISFPQLPRPSWYLVPFPPSPPSAHPRGSSPRPRRYPRYIPAFQAVSSSGSSPLISSSFVTLVFSTLPPSSDPGPSSHPAVLPSPPLPVSAAHVFAAGSPYSASASSKVLASSSA